MESLSLYRKGKGEIVLDFNEILEVRYVKKADLNDIDLAFNHRELLEEFFELYNF